MKKFRVFYRQISPYFKNCLQFSEQTMQSINWQSSDLHTNFCRSLRSNMRLILFPFCFFLANAELYLDNVMIGDVIRSVHKPSCVISKICWSLSKKVSLYSTLAGENVQQISMMQFLNSNGTPKFLSQEQNVVFLVDLSCPNVIEYLQESSSKTLFRSPFRWLLIGDSVKDSQTSIIPEAMTHIEIFPDAEVLLARLVDDRFILHFIYKISFDGEWKTEYYGQWDNQNRFQAVGNLTDSTALRRLDLEGYRIKICYVLTDNDSINHLTDEVNDHIDTITKVNFPTTNHLLDFLNAGREFIYANTWGYRVNGTWNGMTGYLVREEVDVGGSPMFFTSERISIVEYIASPTPTRSKFVFQQPKLSYENNLFLLSFRWTVWYSTVALLFIMFLALLVVAVWEWKKTADDVHEKQMDASVLRANVADIIILIFGAGCQQGSTVELKGSLGRIVMLVLFLALMFLYTSYSANIVALLQSSSSQIKTLDDLLHSRISFGVHDTVFNRYYFSTATEPVRKAIYEKKIAPSGSEPRFMTMEEGVKRMRKGLFAFHMETGVGYKFVGKFFEEGEKCGLKEIQYLQVIDPWLAVRKHTPYKEMFKIGMKRIQEHGLQSRENRLLYEKRPKCSGRESNFVSVSMVDCYPAFLVLSYGALVALGISILENFAYRRQELKKKICWMKQY